VVPVAVGGTAALLIAGAAIVFLRQQPEQPAQPPQVVDTRPAHPVEPKPEPRVEPKPEPPVEPKPEPRKVELVLSSKPDGAAVQFEGQPYGVTPVKLPLVPDAPPVSVTLSLEGYTPKTQQVSAANAPTVLVELERRAATGSKTPGKKQTPTGSSSLGIKKGR
jgi:hypothetical protein